MKNIWLKKSASLSLPSLKMTCSILSIIERRPVRLRVRTPPFHGGDTSSNLVRATKNTFSTARYATKSPQIQCWRGFYVHYPTVRHAFRHFLVHKCFTKIICFSEKLNDMKASIVFSRTHPKRNKRNSMKTFL